MVHEGVMRRSEDVEADLIRSGMSRFDMVVNEVEGRAVTILETR